MLQRTSISTNIKVYLSTHIDCTRNCMCNVYANTNWWPDVCGLYHETVLPYQPVVYIHLVGETGLLMCTVWTWWRTGSKCSSYPCTPWCHAACCTMAGSILCATYIFISFKPGILIHVMCYCVWECSLFVNVKPIHSLGRGVGHTMCIVLIH